MGNRVEQIKQWAAKVFINGKDSGIVETNPAFAFAYYLERARLTGNRYRLEVL